MAKGNESELIGQIEEADAAAAAAAQPYRKTVPIRALTYLSKLGDQPPLRALCGGMIGLGLVTRNGRLVRAGVRALASHTLATVAKDVIKHRVDRSRPHTNPANGSKIRAGTDRSKDETSFPSGHSAGAAAVASAFARDFPEYRTPAYAAAGLIALAQVPRCAHYPSDVGAGIAIGIAADAAVAGAARLAGGDGDS